jgi:MFS-type transporter involved in bile tolerance (Atg22 family)
VAVFPIYFVKVAGAHLVQSRATQQLATVNTVALVLIAIASPILGAASDYSGKKKPLLAAFMGVGVAAVAGLFFVHTGDVTLASWLFILALMGVTGSFVFHRRLRDRLRRRRPAARAQSRLDTAAGLVRAPVRPGPGRIGGHPAGPTRLPLGRGLVGGVLATAVPPRA